MTNDDDTRKAPTNTEKLVNDHPTAMLLKTMLLGPDKAITDQEAQGQRELVNSSTIPTDLGDRFSSSYPSNQSILESFGFKFYGEVPGDSIFQYVDLPEGWIRKASDHSMWSHIDDTKGRARCNIFYKAAFYDRSAHLHINRRYTHQWDYDHFKSTGEITHIVYDGSIPIYTTLSLPCNIDSLYDDEQSQGKVMDKAQELAIEWLTTNYPNWQSVDAYWDD